MNTAIIQTTNDTFTEQVINSKKPVLVDFWAEWCGPCRVQNPILDELADELSDKVSIAKVNIDDNQALAQTYNIMSIPSLLVFKDGEIVHNFVGVQSKEQLLNVFQNQNFI